MTKPNKPQLSGEMEKRLTAEIKLLLYEYNQGNDDSRIVNVVECVDDILATAIEEQRAEGAAEGEVEGINKAIYHLVEVLKSKTTPALITHIVEDLREALTTKEIDHAE